MNTKLYQTDYSGTRPLASLTFSGIDPMQRGETRIEAIIDINANGTLNVSVGNRAMHSSSVVVKLDTGDFTEEEIEKMRDIL